MNLNFKSILETCLILLTVLIIISILLAVCSIFASVYNERHLVDSTRRDNPESFLRTLADSYNNQQDQQRWRDAQTHLQCCGMRSAVQYFEDYTVKCWTMDNDSRNSVEQSFCKYFRSDYADLQMANESKIFRFFEKEKLLQNCELSERRLGCVDILLDRLQNHVKRIRFYALLVIPNLTVCLCTILMFFMGDR